MKDDPKLLGKIVKELSLDSESHHFLCRNIEILKIVFNGTSSTNMKSRGHIIEIWDQLRSLVNI